MSQNSFNLVDYIFSGARNNGRWSETALILTDNDQTISYEGLSEYSDRIRGVLQGLGIIRSDRVAIVMRDTPEWIASFFAITGMGAVSVHTSTLLNADDLSYVLNHSGARLAIITEDQAEKLQSIRSIVPGLENVLIVRNPSDEGNALRIENDLIDFTDAVGQQSAVSVADTDDETLAFLAYTSGSTGKPKGVMHSHKNIRAVIEAYGKNIVSPQPHDRYFASSRLFFTYGLGASLLYPLSAGATTILSAIPPRPDLIANIFAKSKPTAFFGVPSVYRALLEFFHKGNTLDTSSLKFGVSAGEALPAKLSDEWFDLFSLDILDGIGSTEMLHTFIANRFGERHPGSSGRIVPGYKAKLISESREEIIGAGTGNLLVTGNSQSIGYWRDPDKTSEAIVDGWMRTGDVYRRDENDIYWFEGRSDDMFKSKGTWISPIEVEDVLLRHPAVREAAVICGHDHDGLGIVVAYVACTNEIEESEMAGVLRDHTLQFLPRYKCPSVIRFIEELPRTATGKAQRFKLRVLEQQNDTAAN